MEVKCMEFHITEISNNSEEGEDTDSKQKKGKKELGVTDLVTEKSFPCLNTNTDYLEFTAEN